MQTFTTRIDDQKVTIRLYSLDEYEADGGIYGDSGNAGDNMSDSKAEFLAAATVADNDTGLPDNDVLELAGLDRHDYYLDSANGYFLLRDWPADAPLAARMVGASA